MLTGSQMDILKVFKRDLFQGLTFREIKEKSGQKSNNSVQIALKKFKDEGIMKTEKIADISRYRLNLESGLALGYLNLINEHEIRERKMPGDLLASVHERLVRQTTFFILLLFGSLAKGTDKGSSDIDIAVVAGSEKEKSGIIPILETIKRREIRKIDYHVFSEDEFLVMLKDEMENVGKQIYKNGIVISGFISYINLIKGAKR